MQVTFVRNEGQRDRIHVHRDDGSEAGWVFPSFGDGLPHDLVHLVVEDECRLGAGLWARVAGGADPGRILAHANRRGGRDKFAALGADQTELLLSEALANQPWLAPGFDAAQVLAAVTASTAGRPLPPGITLGAIAAARTRLTDLHARWRRCTPKGAITLAFAVRPR